MSGWLGPTTVEGMVALIRAGQGGTPQRKFLRQYLATRLNVEAGRLFAGTLHDVSSYDPGNYLRLTSPRAATLLQIINAIEGKHGTAPTRAQFEIMKDICEALNEK